MKQFTAVLLCLLLCGCSREAPPAPAETAPAISVMAELYDPDHPMEREYPGLVRAYPLTARDVHGIRAMGKDVLLLSGQENTTMTLYTGDLLREAASFTLDFPLEQNDPSLQIHGECISCFDPARQETIVLDRQLREVRRIAAPEGLSGKPILSRDGDILYYCTGWSVAAWDLGTGIRRTVKELTMESQELTGLHLGGRILECTVRQEGAAVRLFLSADQGLEQGSLPEETVLSTGTSHYFAALTDGYQILPVFGAAGAPPELLLPAESWQQQFYLPEDHAAVTVGSREAGISLDYYELNTGNLRSSLTLQASPKSIVNTKDHCVYILADDPGTDRRILYRWDVLRQKPDPANAASYKTAYRSREDPDVQALEACREYAAAIGEQYGITVRIWEEAVAVQPWDYRFTAEHLAPVLERELKLLEERLALYPEGVLQQTGSHFTGLTLCLVRQISGIGDERSLSSATGIQFFRDKEAYVVITTGRYSEQALYHELYHVMETHILTESTALDQWEALNPADFVYGAGQQNTEAYLRGQTRAFVDRYSMGYPKEDRARILENAMLPGRQELFRSEYMQRKLHALCTGIREAYRLKNCREDLLWEQYLVTPLAPQT